MAGNRADQWMHFAEFFAITSSRAIDDQAAACSLLTTLRSNRGAPAVLGFKRAWAWDQKKARLTNEDSWRELPRDLAAVPIPAKVWRDFDDVKEDGKSYWSDDDEKPMMYSSVNWLGGTIDVHKWHMGPAFEPYRLQYLFLRIDARAATAILAGMGASKQGRPPGSGGFRHQDTLVIAKMHKFKRANPGTSINAAAWKYVAEAAGPAIPESKVRRLVDRYLARYGR